jgi:membrane protein implicated in regulation of membrane protease activity
MVGVRQGEIAFLGVFLVVAIVVIGALALLVRVARPLEEDDMERPNRVAQLYGYAVCLIAVVVFLASANSFVENIFTFSNPLRGSSGNFAEASVTSFEAYRSTVNRFNVPGRDATPPPVTPDSVLRARYEALRADRIDQTRFDAEKGLTTSGLLLILSIVLFALHWRWLRSRDVSVHDARSPSVVG